MKLCSVMPLQACQSLPLTAGCHALDVHFSSWTSCWQSAQPHGTQRILTLGFQEATYGTQLCLPSVASLRSEQLRRCELLGRCAARPVTLVLGKMGSLDEIRYSSDQCTVWHSYLDAPPGRAHFLFRPCNSSPAALQPARRLRLHAIR